jgi:hypothetical protein
VSTSLKPTTSIKMIEVFMLVSLVICFNDILMQCYLRHLSNERRRQRAEAAEGSPPPPTLQQKVGFT